MIKLTPKRERQTVGPLRETVSTVFWAFFIAFILRTFLFQPFHIPSNSMLLQAKKHDLIVSEMKTVQMFNAKPMTMANPFAFMTI